MESDIRGALVLGRATWSRRATGLKVLHRPPILETLTRGVLKLRRPMNSRWLVQTCFRLLKIANRPILAGSSESVTLTSAPLSVLSATLRQLPDIFRRRTRSFKGMEESFPALRNMTTDLFPPSMPTEYFLGRGPGRLTSQLQLLRPNMVPQCLLVGMEGRANIFCFWPRAPVWITLPLPSLRTDREGLTRRFLLAPVLKVICMAAFLMTLFFLGQKWMPSPGPFPVDPKQCCTGCRATLPKNLFLARGPLKMGKICEQTPLQLWKKVPVTFPPQNTRLAYPERGRLQRLKPSTYSAQVCNLQQLEQRELARTKVLRVVFLDTRSRRCLIKQLLGANNLVQITPSRPAGTPLLEWAIQVPH